MLQDRTAESVVSALFPHADLAHPTEKFPFPTATAKSAEQKRGDKNAAQMLTCEHFTDRTFHISYNRKTQKKNE